MFYLKLLLKTILKRQIVNKQVSDMDITKYFRKSTNDKLDGRALNISIQCSSSSSVLSAPRKLNSFQEQQEQEKKR